MPLDALVGFIGALGEMDSSATVMDVASLKAPVMFDGRNLFVPARMGSLGFTYYGIGT